MIQPKAANQKNQTSKRVILLAADHKKSVVAEVVDGTTNALVYNPYGHQSGQQDAATRLGFNGVMRESKIGWYLLGNGYRVYNPLLMRFHSPDSWSPFGRGGLNAYMYCVGDPVNRSDPTGHWSIPALFSSTRSLGFIGYLTSTVGAGLNLFSFVANGGQHTLASNLGAISSFTGSVAGVSAFLDLAPQASQLLSATSVASGIASTYLGVRSARASLRQLDHLDWFEAPFRRPSGSPPPYFADSTPPLISRVAPASPPTYPLNHSTMLPARFGDRPPAYSMQDTGRFSEPLPNVDNPSTVSPFAAPIPFDEPWQIRFQARLRGGVLDQMDGINASRDIRQRH